MKRKDSPDVSQDERVEQGATHEQEAKLSSDSKYVGAFTRRRFLITGAGAVAGAAALLAARDTQLNAQQQGSGQGKRPGGGGGGGGKPRVPSALTQSDSSTSPKFSQPEAVTARTVRGQSAVNLELTAAMTQWMYMCEGQTAYAEIPIYNGNVPGPTIYVDPGTTINITLNNDLPVKSQFTDNCDMDMKGKGAMQSKGGKQSSETTPQCFMHTNLHTHGLWVSPNSLNKDGSVNQGYYQVDGKNPALKSSSDDVLLDIFPQQSNNYCIVLPDFHDPGTYWYHSHVHGSSAYQVSSGMAGAIIIREPAGEELVPAERDRVFLMQEVVFEPPPPPNPPPAAAATPNIPIIYQEHSTTQGSAGFLLNGQCKPTIQIKTGQNNRWRFINGTGTPRGMLKLRLIKMSNNPQAVINDEDIFDCGQDPTGYDPTQPNSPGNVIFPVKTSLEKQGAHMHLIAVDGLTFYGFDSQPVRKHLIAPGNRADFIINIPNKSSFNTGPGKYALVKDVFPKDGVSFNQQPTLDCSIANQTLVQHTVGATLRTTQVLAYVEVYPGTTRGEALPKLPKTRPFNLQPIAKVDRSRTGKDAIVFMGLGGGAAGGNPGGNFLINCKVYDPLSQGIVAKLNTAEEWELESIGGLGGLGSGTDFPHPFHIHVNPFQVVGRTVDFETDDPKLDPKSPCNWIWQDTVAIPATIAPLTPNTDCAVTTCANPRPTPSATPTPTPSPTPSPSPTPTPPACPPIPPNPGHLRIRTRFLIYPGQYVIHCHILIHEDVGMMSNVTIQGSGVGPCEKVSAPPQAAVDCVNKTKAQC